MPRNDRAKPTIYKKRTIDLDVISISISVIALITSITFSVITFVLPLTRSRLVIEDPSVVYTMKNETESFDEIIIPLICTNYGNYIRSINKIEAIITYKDRLIPVKPIYVYDKVSVSAQPLPGKYYASYVIPENSGVEKYIGFKFDSNNFTWKDKIPSEFHFKPGELYSMDVRIYTTRNSFKSNDREIIQVSYGFETEDTFDRDSIYAASGQCWFRINDSHIFPAYE